jgi:hypothetical protein
VHFHVLNIGNGQLEKTSAETPEFLGIAGCKEAVMPAPILVLCEPGVPQP